MRLQLLSACRAQCTLSLSISHPVLHANYSKIYKCDLLLHLIQLSLVFCNMRISCLSLGGEGKGEVTFPIPAWRCDNAKQPQSTTEAAVDSSRSTTFHSHFLHPLPRTRTTHPSLLPRYTPPLAPLPYASFLPPSIKQRRA